MSEWRGVKTGREKGTGQSDAAPARFTDEPDSQYSGSGELPTESPSNKFENVSAALALGSAVLAVGAGVAFVAVVGVGVTANVMKFLCRRDR